MKLYVAGFMFSHDKKRVALIRKTDKHDLKWQAGLLNGIGGKINPNESPIRAMRREFDEEGGVDEYYWKHFCTLTQGLDWKVFFFSATGCLETLRSMTDELIEIVDVESIPYREDLIPNLKWLIELALDKKGPVAEIQQHAPNLQYAH